MTGPHSYGARWAPVYDRIYAHLPGADEAAAFLAEFAGGGRALELGIGTGRIALPLAARGVEVHGIDASPDMVAVLRSKPGGDSIPVTIGDFADVPVEGTFELIYVVFNTFFALTSQERQVDCCVNVGRHLSPGGRFVIEAFVPDPGLFPGGARVQALHVSDDEVALDVGRVDRNAQQVVSHMVVLGSGRSELYPIRVRYAYPSELDLMARLAGLTLVERWADWSRARFTATSTGHVSVYAPA